MSKSCTTNTVTDNDPGVTIAPSCSQNPKVLKHLTLADIGPINGEPPDSTSGDHRPTASNVIVAIPFDPTTTLATSKPTGDCPKSRTLSRMKAIAKWGFMAWSPSRTPMLFRHIVPRRAVMPSRISSRIQVWRNRASLKSGLSVVALCRFDRNMLRSQNLRLHWPLYTCNRDSVSRDGQPASTRALTCYLTRGLPHESSVLHQQSEKQRSSPARLHNSTASRVHWASRRTCRTLRYEWSRVRYLSGRRYQPRDSRRPSPGEGPYHYQPSQYVT